MAKLIALAVGTSLASLIDNSAHIEHTEAASDVIGADQFIFKQSAAYKLIKDEGASISAYRKEHLSDKGCFENGNQSDSCKLTLDTYLTKAWDHLNAKHQWCASTIADVGVRETIALDTEGYCDFALSVRSAKYGFTSYPAPNRTKYENDTAGK